MKKTGLCIQIPAFAMKVALLYSFLMLVFTTWSFAKEAEGQEILDKKVTLNIKNENFKTALRKIGDAAGIKFSYTRNTIPEKERVTIRANEETLASLFYSLFQPYSIQYEAVGNQVILKRKELLGLLIQQEIVTPAANDFIPINGTVKDAEGKPVAGVSVVVKGSSKGTSTNANGAFAIDANPGDILDFSMVGYLPVSVTVRNSAPITVQLQTDVSGLGEVVVVGYGTQKKVNLTGAISSIKTEQLANIPAANLSNTIAGRAPGVTAIGTTGLAGASSSIRIRGSFEEPLYVINGIIKSKADFDALDANEVASINFLKDAASATVYGSKAGNGVVLVTTKAGVIQKPTLEYKGSYSFSEPTRPIQNFTATQEIEYLNQIAVTQGQPKPYGQEIYDYFKDKSYNINDYIWQNPTVQQHNLAVRGGTEAITYYLHLGYHDEEGSYKNLGYNRYNFRSDVTANISKRFKVNVNLSGNQRNYHRWYWPYDGAEDFNVGDFFRATFNWTRLYPFYVDDQGNPTTNTDAFPVVPGAWHPVELMVNSGGYRDIKYRTLDGILRFDLDLGDMVKGLSTSLQASLMGGDRNLKSFVIHNKAYIFQSASATNKFIPGPIDPTKINLHNLSSNYQNVAEEVNFYNSYQMNWYLKYDRTFDKHTLSALAVYEQASEKGKYLNGRADELLSPTIDQIYNTSSDIAKRWFSGNESESARASWIGRLNYTFNNKYIAEFSFRYDGNYKFAPDKQWGFFPAFSAAWRISQEKFMQNAHWLNDLKIRGSYGTSGNDDVGAFLWSQTYVKSSGYVFGSSYYDGLQPGAMPNPDITWSTSEMTDLGLDYGMLNNRLYGEIDFFKRRQKDILGTRLGSTPSTLGATLPAVNYAARSWKGFEFSANWTGKLTRDIKFTVYANMGYAVDRWDILDEAEALRNGTYKNNWRSAIGKPANRVYGLISKGIIRTQEELDKLPTGFTQFGREPKLGYLLFEDIRGDNYSEGPDGKIDNNDMTYLSDNGAPRINYGIGFRAEWKGLSINGHFQGVGAYDRMISTRNGGGVFQVDRPYFEIWADNYWTPENPNAKYPRVSGEWLQPDIGGGPSSFWLRNGAYIRLKNVDIAYSIPNSWLGKLGFKRVQLFVNATNLFCISGLTEHDPEQLTLDSYPLMKTFTGGLNLNF